MTSITELYKGMKSWMKLARQSAIPELLSFCGTIERHLMGIVYHAKFPISSGKVEGVNNLIKTIRRKAYGFRDTEYFFLKILNFLFITMIQNTKLLIYKKLT